MDHRQNGISDTEISSNSTNKHHHHRLFIKRTLQFLLPVSLASLLLPYTSGFSIFFTYYIHYCFSTLVFPILTHAFERKYMFLICNGILVFLVKTLTFNNTNNPSSFSSLEYVNENYSSPEISQVNGSEPESDSYPEINVAHGEDGDDGDDEEDQKHLPRVADPEVSDDEIRGKPDVRCRVGAEYEERKTGDFIIESEELEMLSEVNEDDYEDDEECDGRLGEEKMDAINLNTEELNKKFEEFIRKMKEELRIQEQQPLIAAV